MTTLSITPGMREQWAHTICPLFADLIDMVDGFATQPFDHLAFEVLSRNTIRLGFVTPDVHLVAYLGMSPNLKMAPVAGSLVTFDDLVALMQQDSISIEGVISDPRWPSYVEITSGKAWTKPGQIGMSTEALKIMLAISDQSEGNVWINISSGHMVRFHNESGMIHGIFNAV